jgi:ankyrin repeat protein
MPESLEKQYILIAKLLQLIFILAGDRKTNSIDKLEEKIRVLPRDFNFDIKFIITKKLNSTIIQLVEVYNQLQELKENQELVSFEDILLSKIGKKSHKLFIEREFKCIILDVADNKVVEINRIRHLLGLLDDPNLVITSVNGGDLELATPLHVALSASNRQVASVLLESKKIRLNIRFRGFTDFHIAVRMGYLDIAEAILKNSGSDILNETINIANFQSQSANALHIAIIMGYQEIANWIIEKASKKLLRAEVDQNFTLLEIAMLGSESDMIKMAQEMAKAEAFKRQSAGKAILNPKTALHMAVERNFIEVVNAIIKKADKHVLNAKDNDGETPLSLAMKNGLLDIAIALINAKAIDLRIKLPEGLTYLQMALNLDLEDCFKLIIEKLGSEVVNEKDSSGFTIFLEAIEHNNLSIVKFMLENYDVDLTLRLAEGYTALHIAAEDNLIDMFDVLIKKADKNILIMQNESGNTALHIAAKFGNLEIVNSIIQQADIDILNIRNADDFTALDLAIKNGHLDVVKSLIKIEGVNINAKSKKGVTALHLAFKHNKIQIIKFLIGLDNIDLNIKFGQGSSIYHFAARIGDKDIFNLLIEKLGNELLDAKNNHGITPLRVGAENGHLDIVNLLIGCGANCNSQDKHGIIPLHAALEYGHQEVVRVLMKYLDDTFDKNAIYRAFYYAVQNGYTEIVENLVKRLDKESINYKIHNDITILHLAAEIGHTEIVKILLNNGARLDIKNIDGTTAFVSAVLYGNKKDLIKLFLDYGADIKELAIIGLVPPNFSDKKVKGWGINIDKDILQLLKQHWLENQKVLQQEKVEEVKLKQIKHKINTIIKEFGDLLPPIRDEEPLVGCELDELQIQSMEALSKIRGLMQYKQDPLGQKLLSIIATLSKILEKKDSNAEKKSHNLCSEFFQLIKGEFINLLKEDIKKVSDNQKSLKPVADQEEIEIKKQTIIEITNFLLLLNIIILRQLEIVLSQKLKLVDNLLHEGLEMDKKESEKLETLISMVEKYLGEQYMLKIIIAPNLSNPKRAEIAMQSSAIPSTAPESPAIIISRVTEDNKKVILDILKSDVENSVLKIKSCREHGYQADNPHIKRTPEELLRENHHTELSDLRSVLGDAMPREISQFLLNTIVELITDPGNSLMRSIATKQGGSHAFELLVPKIFPAKMSEISDHEKDGYVAFFRQVVSVVRCNGSYLI